MPPHVDPEVQAVREAPTEGESITVLLGVDGEKETVEIRVSEVGGEVCDDLPFGGLRVNVPQTSLDVICALDNLKSVEARHTVKTH